MSVYDQFILPKNSLIRTFDCDEKLPNLPVPSLEHTIHRYLESVKPFAENEEEYLETKKIADEFLNGVGAVLHSKLSEHAKKHRNWVEQWWEDYAYLTLREPLIPYYNMSGPHPRLPKYQYKPGQQIKTASAFCYHMVKFWQVLREERLNPGVTVNKQPLSMDQFRRFFNCSVAPGLTKDTINSYFKTEREGSCSSQVLVLCKGHMFVVDSVQPDGQSLTKLEWEHQLNIIKQKASSHKGTDVPRLSCDYRTPWAKNKQHLINLDPVNHSIFATIDAAMFVLCLDDACPNTDSAANYLTLYGDYTCRWPDSATNVIFYNNGVSGGLCVHSAFDGIVSGAATIIVYSAMQEDADDHVGKPDSQNLAEPQHLNFVLDKYIRSEIERIKTDVEKEKKNFIMSIEEFDLFGKQRIQEFNVHPDSFIQMALQLAYYRLHSRFAPCYETATTRTFYHGRTETLRSCTEDCVRWVKSMANPQVKDSVRKELLMAAIQKHNHLMTEARNGEGCDRHLLGLYCIAVENDIPVPQLYLDPLFHRSGGGGNFILSTSLLGYTPVAGGVSPMCINGYGIFYNILPDSLLFTISVRRDSEETSSKKMFQSIRNSLHDMASLLETHISSKL